MRRSALFGLMVAVLLAAPVSVTAAPAGRAAGSRVERRVSCATAQGALQMFVFAENPAAGTAAADIGTGDPNSPTPIRLLAVDTRYKHYALGKSCRPTTKRIALTHRGLTSAGVVVHGDYRSPSVYCSATRRVLIHFRLGFDSAGKPVSALIAVRTQPKPGKKSKPIGYVQWTPQKSVTYYSTSACTSQG